MLAPVPASMLVTLMWWLTILARRLCLGVISGAGCLCHQVPSRLQLRRLMTHNLYH